MTRDLRRAINAAMQLWPINRFGTGAGAGGASDAYLLETGDTYLLESGDRMLLENSTNLLQTEDGTVLMTESGQMLEID